MLVALIAPAPALPARRPTVAVAIHEGCPCPRECAPALNRLARDLAPWARVLAVVDSDAAGTRAELAQTGLALEGRADPSGTLLRRMGARFTMDVALLDSSGRRVRSWKGFDRKVVVEVAAELRHIGASELALDPAEYPERTQTGCELKLSGKKRNASKS